MKKYIKLYLLGITFLLTISTSYSYETYSFEEIEVAKVICAESCGGGKIGQWGVANVISNRSKLWHLTPHKVVTQKNQFFGYTASNKEELFSQCKNEALPLSKYILQLRDLTNGAIYFLRPGEEKGSWIGEKTVTIGKHTFYKEKE
jgi:spore germination cell wall hydrolase CwlJ-like protein